MILNYKKVGKFINIRILLEPQNTLFSASTEMIELNLVTCHVQIRQYLWDTERKKAIDWAFFYRLLGNKKLLGTDAISVVTLYCRFNLSKCVEKDNLTYHLPVVDDINCLCVFGLFSLFRWFNIKFNAFDKTSRWSDCGAIRFFFSSPLLISSKWNFHYLHINKIRMHMTREKNNNIPSNV